MTDRPLMPPSHPEHCAACGRPLALSEATRAGAAMRATGVLSWIARSPETGCTPGEWDVFLCRRPTECGDPHMRRWLRDQCTPPGWIAPRHQ